MPGVHSTVGAEDSAAGRARSELVVAFVAPVAAVVVAAAVAVVVAAVAAAVAWLDLSFAVDSRLPGLPVAGGSSPQQSTLLSTPSAYRTLV